MAELQKFNQLFEELEKSVATLTKAETDLKTNNALLESRNTFLAEQIKKLNSKKQEVLDAVEVSNQELAAMTAGIKIGIEDAENSATTRKNELNTELSTVQTALEASKRELKEVNDDLLVRRSTLKELSTAKEQLEIAIKAVEGKLSEKRINLKDIQLEVDDARVKADKLIASYGAEVDAAKGNLKILKSKVDEANDDLESIKEQVVVLEDRKKVAFEKYKQFLEYEKQVKKVLKAREDALLEGESRLAQRSRRNSVLDNMN
jgi:chromosome segregation ATPase